MISPSDSRVSRVADEDSWGKSRAKASTTSSVAASAMTTSTGLVGFAIGALVSTRRERYVSGT
jgi:hypothetical protein